MNKNELNVLKAVMDNAQDCSGGDFAFTDETLENGVEGLTANQIKGYFSALQSKGMIYISESSSYESGDCQTEFDKEPLEELLKAGLVDEAYCKEFECWYW